MVSHPEVKKRMPPADSGVKSLTDEQRQTLREWILAGGEYRPHWAFVPPQWPVVPTVGDAWARNPIDRFVFEGLRTAGLTPMPEAGKSTLLRRASLTLTGLPPTPDELRAFLADSANDAYEKAVDRLLASPRYGEHQARYWLDAVRYGDTHGLHLDNERLVWPYRDWVVRALNQDLPFDQFAKWQLAGDLLPDPSLDQLVATGYVRMNPTTNEGGAIEAEFLAKNTFDRIDTTSTVFLGLTVACARCHDHKYDPISQRDYFSLYAFFNSTADKPLDDNALLPGPVIEAPTPEQQEKLRDLNTELSRREAAVEFTTASHWVVNGKVEMPTIKEWEISGPYSAANFDVAFATASPAESKPTEATWRSSDFMFGKASSKLVGQENSAAYLRTTLTVTTARELELALQSDDGVRVWLNDVLVHDKKVLRGINDAIDKFLIRLVPGENRILVKVVNAGGEDGLSIQYGDLSAERINAMAAIIAEGKLSQADKDEIRRLYLQYGPETPANLGYRRARASLAVLKASIPKTLIARELKKPRPAHVLKRGEYSMPQEEVSRSVPPALGRLPERAPLNRLGFAAWLMSPEHPLTARVLVNRVWQQHFGTGIVKSSEDFGNQGEWPSHPELLDWMALRIQKDGWSLKALHRLIVTSATFRQSAISDVRRRQVDPENRLISRGPRFRLDAEVIRDQALYVSGLLNERMGGPGFRPPQPPGLWEDIAYPSSNTAKYIEDKDESVYRRSLYMFWKRTSPHPVMLAFDSPMREMCSVRRPVTNTPMQALVTLNEPQFQLAAKNLALRLHKTEGSTADRLHRLYELTVCRPPTTAEIELLQSAWLRYANLYESQAESAAALTGQAKGDGISHLAAWQLIATIMLNSDEFLTQH